MNKFTKTHTQIAKGVAILMMLYHHLFVIPDRINSNFFSLIDQIIPNAQITIATFCKLCVCIYVFLSGYGLYFSLRNKTTLLSMYKDIALRLLKFWTTFVVIFILFVPIGMITGTISTDWKQIILGLSGFALTFFNDTWWFINAYVIILIVSPLFVYLFGNQHLVKRILTICILPLVYILGRIILFFVGSNLFIDTYFWYLESYPLLLSLFIGVFCARFKVYEKCMSVFDKITNIKLRIFVRTLSMLVILTFSIILRIVTVRNVIDMRCDFIVAPLFVFSISTIIYDIKYNHFFILCGNHSTVMWLTHTFLCYQFAQELVVVPYYSELIFLWFILLSLITSHLVNLILIPLNHLLFDKNHKLSFKGYFTL